MTPSIGPANKILAASYVTNQFYYRQSNQPSTALTRFRPAIRLQEGTIASTLKSASDRIASFVKAAGDVKQSALSLTQPAASAFRQRQATSSNPAKTAVTAASGAAIATYRIRTDQVASAQRNGGTLLDGNGPTALAAGINEIKFTIGGRSKTVSAFVFADDTNDKALNRIKDAINQAKTGVTATISTDAATGMRKLELTGDATGAGQSFTVEDVKGNAASAAGVLHASQTAKDAIYRVNGGAARTSSTNTIELEKGKVTATLLQPDAEDAVITVQPDEKAALRQVKQLVSDYNAMRDRLDEAGGYMVSSVRRGLDDAIGGYESIGIRRRPDGRLEVDDAAFSRSFAARPMQTGSLVTGRYGLADRLSQAADRLSSVAPASLMNVKAQGIQSWISYGSTMSPYMPIRTTGWLFDGMF